MSDTTAGFHTSHAGDIDQSRARQLRFRYSAHFHPFVGRLRGLLEDGRPLRQVLEVDTDGGAEYDQALSVTASAGMIKPGTRFPRQTLDLRPSSAYGLYNWEIFFHAPLLIATQLSRNQRFEEAREWFHTIFNPGAPGLSTANDGPARYWQFKPFRDGGATLTRDLLLNIATGDQPVEGESEDQKWQRLEAQEETAKAMAAWRANPFSPDTIARYRPSAYMMKTVFAYLDNLIAWGDSLFREDTRESINEATQIYVLAARLLGPRPQEIPRNAPLRPTTYNAIRYDAKRRMEELELDLPFDSLPHPPRAPAEDPRLHTVKHLHTSKPVGSELPFCVPPNPKLASYWDTVADRLFKIRNSQNIDGAFRQLALFAPPIDPALLLRAASAGVNVASVVNGTEQPLPTVRFAVMLQRALELAQEVKSLGGQVLAALEKKENEALSRLRSTHELTILRQAKDIRYAQVQEADKQVEALKVGMTSAFWRWRHYEKLLGNTDPQRPELADLDEASLRTMNLQSRELNLPGPAASINQRVEALDGESTHISVHEKQELALMNAAQATNLAASTLELSVSLLHLIPTATLAAAPLGIGSALKVLAGEDFAKIGAFVASAGRTAAGEISFHAGQIGRHASYERREQDWIVQRNAAAGELNQLSRQLRAAEIRRAIAKREQENHDLQITHAQEIDEFLANKKTGEGFYLWHAGELKGLHARGFALAYEAARKAQTALRHELGTPALSFLDSAYLDGDQALLAGERLFQDLKRMELAYLDQNKREYEITRHVSLLQLDPLALVQLRATGLCRVRIPEELFDTDGPGHYFRRLKTVSLSLQCVAGPYASISCKVTQTSSTIRRSPSVSGGYTRGEDTDERFSDADGHVQSIVTSTGTNDSGLFELSMRDERYLPFEGTGAISEWELELPSELRQFDYDTISDVVMHLRYTARDGGAALKSAATEHLRSLIDGAKAPGVMRLFSLRHEFPTEWALFKASTATTPSLTVTLRREHYPFWLSRASGYQQAVVFARTSETSVTLTADSVAHSLGTWLEEGEDEPRITTSVLVDILTPATSGPPIKTYPTGTVTVAFNTKALDDVYLAVTLKS